MTPTPQRAEYWNRTLRMTAFLLLVWFVVTFLVAWLARELSYRFFGWPFSFYMGAQGSLVVYLVLIAFYARYMNRLDREFDVDEPDDP